jgi:hypothetical protein
MAKIMLHKDTADDATEIMYSTASHMPTMKPQYSPKLTRARPYAPPANGSMEVISALQIHSSTYDVPSKNVAHAYDPNPANKPTLKQKYCPPMTMVIPAAQMSKTPRWRTWLAASSVVSVFAGSASVANRLLSTRRSEFGADEFMPLLRQLKFFAMDDIAIVAAITQFQEGLYFEVEIKIPGVCRQCDTAHDCIEYVDR